MGGFRNSQHYRIASVSDDVAALHTEGHEDATLRYRATY